MSINRIIILGNGFDIAHGLKTKYTDFLNNYYENIKDSSFKDDLLEFKISGYDLSDKPTLNEMIDYMSKFLGPAGLMHPEKNIHFNRRLGIELKNVFFYEISKKLNSQWVDIETDYYNSLINIIDSPDRRNIHEKIKQLNDDVDSITKKFENYLSKNVKPKIKSKYILELDEIFRNKHLSEEIELKNFLKEFPAKYSKEIENEIRRDFLKNIKNFLFNETLVLNFNYTNTAHTLYNKNLSNSKFINIHGGILDKENPIVLGFGDEMHKRYSDIEETNENEFLRLMKSFAYTNTDNYRQLFDFIESNDFQIQIMGHSCGISDRTLLNAIFEHQNCKSIKIFYYKSEDDRDNYSDIVRSISRHFNKKLLMRNKIVNKTLSIPLPQFKSKN